MTSSILGKLTPYAKKEVLLKESQSTTDIIKQIENAHDLYKNEYDKISDQFWKGNVVDSCKFIFDFLKKNVRYRIEPDSRQSVKSPAAIIATGRSVNGYNDCKHYSLFFAGLLDSWRRKGKNIDWAFRFANYKLFNKSPHHVFVVVNPKKNEIWCDAVLEAFNQKKSYRNAIDKNINNMALYSISGFEDKKRRFERSFLVKHAPAKKVNKFSRAQMFSGMSKQFVFDPHAFGGLDMSGFKKKAKNVFRGAKKVVLAPNRKAFLLLVQTNVFKIALHLYKALRSPKRDRLLKTWIKLGGNPVTFEKIVTKAFLKYVRRHKVEGIGEVTTAALLAAAAPILAAIAQFLPQGSKAQQIAETAATVTQTQTNEG
jgi:hypothetical protein